MVGFERECKSLAGVGAMFALPPPPLPRSRLDALWSLPLLIVASRRFWPQINISLHLHRSGLFCVGWG